MADINKTIELLEKQLKEMKILRAKDKEEQDRYEEYNKRLDKLEGDITKILNAVVG